MLKLTAYIMKQYCILYERDGMRWLDYVLRCDCHAIPVCESKWRWRYLKRKLKTYKRKFSNVRLLFFFKKRVNGCAPQPADRITSAGQHSAGTMKPSARQAAPLPALQPTERIIASASSSSGASQLTEQALAPRLDLTEVQVRMSWRQVMPWESFEYDYSPQGGTRRGYAVQSQIFLHGHDNCAFHRSEHPDNVTWFLQHSDSEHGFYPMNYTNTNNRIWLAQLREQMPSLRPGFVVHVNDHSEIFCLSYGHIRSIF